MKLSVIICTHNPRQDYLKRTLDALQQQTLTHDQWELLLIDNASEEPMENAWDLSWHPQGRHLREAELGLTPARLRGIRESRGELLVFVDDDNVLDVQYLQCALQIADDLPFLGAWGGACVPEFEVPPDPDLSGFLSCLALRDVQKPRWSNYDCDTVPLGAGLCVRAGVARKFLLGAKDSPVRRMLGRRGASLLGGEDFDIAMTSYDMGLGTGIFPQLRLCHLIPRHRLEPEYLYRICVAGLYSAELAKFIHSGESPPLQVRRSPAVERLIRLFKSVIFREKASRRDQAYQAGMRMAEEDIRCIQLGKPLKWLDTL